MDIQAISLNLRQDATTVVFINVLLQQLGLPIPAVPTLLLAGSMMATGGQMGQILAVTVAASVLADLTWYGAGRAFGYRVLSGLCRLSINPAACVSQTEGRFARWGVWSMVLAKFVPGFSTVAPPIAGALRMSLPGFLFAAGLGALMWGGAAIAVGWLLRAQVAHTVAALDRHGASLAVALAGAFGVWLGWKFWQKYRFERLAAIPHVSPQELLEALASDNPPLVLDLRSGVMVAETGVVPGAVAAENDRLAEAVGDWPKSRPIVTLCACPADASAIQAARALLAQGYTRVRPLRGGFNALPPELRPPERD